jgi:hypothetical protein
MRLSSGKSAPPGRTIAGAALRPELPTLSASSVIHSTTTQINVAVGDFTVSANDVGNVLQITGGTATAGFYEITVADVANNRWTLDRSAGVAAQTVVGAMGGALASPSIAAKAKVAGNDVYIKAGAYSCSSTADVTAGRIAEDTGGTVASRARWVGYNAARDDGGTRPVLTATSNSMQIFLTSANRD